VLIGIELMLAAANINFVAFWRGMPASEGAAHAPDGVMFVMFAIAIAAAEVAVGMALVISVFRHRRTSDVSQLDQLKG
jgi:NADH-quinone oxidoreductase subunit K